MPSERVKQRILEEIDFLELVQSYNISLRNVGGDNYLGRSPFTNDTNPSFRVNAASKVFNCLATKTGGGVFKFVEEMEQIDRSEAIALLMERLGIEDDSNDEDNELSQMLKCVKAAHQFFRQYADTAIEVMTGPRLGMSADVVEKYELGYAPADRKALIKHLKYHGFTEEIIYKCGIAKDERASGKPCLSFYYDRVIYPIRDRGKLVGLSGRRMQDPIKDPKTKEEWAFNANIPPDKYRHGFKTRIFRKDEILWGIEQARKLKQSYLVGMEGFNDAIASNESGIPAAATLGATPSKKQLIAISKVTNDLYLCFDTDSAGQEALYKSFWMLEELQLPLIVYAVVLPGGKDPADFVRDNGQEAFRKLLASAQPDTAAIVEYMVEKHKKDSTTPSALRRKVLEDLKDHMKYGSMFSYRADDLIERVSQILGLSQADLRKWLREGPNFGHSSQVYKKIERITFPAPIYERRIMLECLRDPLKVHQLQGEGISLRTDFESALVARVLGILYSVPKGHDPFNALEEKLDKEQYELVVATFNDNASLPADFNTTLTVMKETLARQRGASERKTNFLGKKLTASEGSIRPVISDMIKKAKEPSDKNDKTI